MERGSMCIGCAVWQEGGRGKLRWVHKKMKNGLRGEARRLWIDERRENRREGRKGKEEEVRSV